MTWQENCASVIIYGLDHNYETLDQCSKLKSSDTAHPVIG
jgi:hypothetical protein